MAAGGLDAGAYHSCALLPDGSVRCWGFNGNGQLGYGNTTNIGDDESPGSVGPVDLGPGRTAKAISAGDAHTCALLDDGSVRCWGFGGDGRLGYGNTTNIGDDESPGSVGPVDLGPGRTAKAISAGAAHTCALLDDGSVRCWGFGGEPFPRDGRLGYGNTNNVGDNEAPGSVGPVKLGRSAVAISAGDAHTCALLDDKTVKCWGRNDFGQLGYGNTNNVGDTPTTTPDTVGPVNLGPGHTAKAISAGAAHTCALLDDDTVRCWGDGAAGRLGYGNENTIGDNETPDSVALVNVGSGRTAKAISAGDNHTCAVLDDGSVRCWGLGASGRLGYGNQHNIGDDETPDSVGPVDLGRGRTAMAISTGKRHTCARLDDDSIRCWGDAATGRLGYCNANDIGDDEAPGSVGPVNVSGSSACPVGAAPPADGGGGAAPPVGAYPVPASPPGPRPPRVSRAELYRRALAAQARRKRALGGCYAKVGRHAKRELRHISRRDSSRRRARAKRHIKRHRAQGRRVCRKRYGRTPGRVTRLSARAVSKSKIALSFAAPGTDRGKPPAARTYVIKQSRRPIRGSRSFARAQTLCRGRCRFKVTLVGAKATLTVKDLRPHATYYYSVAPLDNVSGRRGPRSPNAKARTRRR